MKFRYSLIATALLCGAKTAEVQAVDNFATLYQQQVHPFWQTVTPQQLKLSDGTGLHYVLMKPDQVKATVVVVNGRTESYLKYQELAYQLTEQGYQVLMFDHRGQGLSARLTDNPHKGHIEDFQQYIDDMHQLISRVVLADKVQADQKLPMYLIGHSMGGAISTLYLQQHPQVFQKAALSAPMHGINGKLVYDEWDACRLASTVTLFSTEGYAGFADKPYSAVPFAGNELTGSKERYQWMQRLYQDNPQLQLGGATWGWLEQACAVLPQMQQQADKINIPLLVMQAELDTIVSAAAQQEFCTALAENPNSGCVGGLQRIKGAKHELLFEQDEIRQLALEKVLAHFASE
ncbi:MAG: alpha/beta fold hydrolase [Gammaproteobacteria bacterium]|nr:alpha/beta fold hydrolase [Gammaproteobacteria bacterium]MBU2059064.1 alpha/beta fold hydrolase [Gammaproteobacteria bacterium]MBU2173500.1 alpha/beta fold hydrolase [Gammaproteobacteria bacterium]MBU2245579.1 alpha/beta fold hydrolase [Gammaproteobacteria bacterium]MBU2344997.1 alpha/beta fold hydrolase [Gammaproteobacteria bacterium]